ncbi:hypothetical protein ACPOL_0851 [Acidisarcina polymorpha]|uniref:Uncharacterized protein n=1 Tax=Acidisarcina polymorpha TaxID=2211140 RepID=A0A2Z5FTP7_9BACT|nr:hypothetical protein ACPOL_0851 [Acidisarcina polymorpha]
MSPRDQGIAGIAELLPLPTTTFFVLFALAGEDKHGYRSCKM